MIERTVLKMTRETLEKLPEIVRKNIEGLRHGYKSNVVDKYVAQEKAAWYVKGLRDAGLITERERQILFIYTTV